MGKPEMKYSKTSFAVNVPQEQVICELHSNPVELKPGSAKEHIEWALDHPINSPKVEEIVRPGEKVCIIIPDLTRKWQSPHIYIPILVERLNRIGVKDGDILIISATGTHRAQTEEEKVGLVSKEIYERIEFLDHDCTDEGNLQHVGTTSQGTPVRLNRRALDCDRIILTGGAVFHFLAGFGGGRKYILPGIAARDTIMKNHNLALLPGFGSGSNPFVKSGIMDERNPLHMDMMEAAAMVKPDFVLNVVADSDFNIISAFAGDYIDAHKEACALLNAIDGVTVPKKAGLVIASAGGFPKDINLYQTSKTLCNVFEIIEEGGTYIILSECSEGFGSGDTERQICAYDNMLDREKNLREDFSIGAYIGYMFCDSAAKYKAILVTDMEQEFFNNAGIRVAKTLDDALAIARELNGGKLDMDIALLPHGANTMPIIR